MSVLRPILRRVVAFLARNRFHRDPAHDPLPPKAAGESPPPVHADERTIRRVMEAELGGTSSSASRAAYLRGDNPGGLHRGGRGPAPVHPRGGDDLAPHLVLDLSEPILDTAPPSSVSFR